MNKPPHIVVVDDDREIRALLCDYLEKNGFRATGVADGRLLERQLQKQPADLIVLDLMLPGDDGFAICRRLRTTSNVPVIMLTARDEDVDQIVGFEVGADDYVRKPFNPRALLGRVRAVLRRADHTQGGAAHRVAVYVFSGWRLDVASRQLRNSAGVIVELNGAEFELLALLLADAKRVWSRLELSQQLHGRDNDPLDRSIDVRISRLRQKLGDPARSPTILKTVYGGGYVMGVPVVVE